MLISVTGDLHLNNNTYGVKDAETGLPIKTVDSFRALDFFVDTSIDRKVDRVVMAGDIWDNHHPDSELQEMFNERVQKLCANDIQVVIMAGNHDFSGKKHAVKPVRGWLPKIKVVDKAIVENGKGYKAIYVPHTSEIESGETTFPQLVASMRVEREGDEPVMFFGHFSLNGAMRNDSSEHSSKLAVSAGDVEATGATIGFMAHFHKFQKVGDGIPIYYVGSLERHRLDEINGDRGFFIFDTETQEHERVNYSDQRPMRKIYAESLDEAMDDIMEEDSWEGCIARIEFEGEEKEYAKIKSNFKKLRSEFRRKGGAVLKLADVKYMQSDDDEEGATAMSVDDLDLMEMISKRVSGDHDGDEEEQHEIMNIVKEVYKKAEEKK